MVEKLTREPGRLASMADIGGVRALCDTQGQADTLHGKLTELLDVARVRDWARSPRATGYRGIHLHARHGGRVIEIQLRTVVQDAWANLVEEESRDSGIDYKGGQGGEDVLDFFRLAGEMYRVIETGDLPPGLMPRVNAAYRNARPALVAPRLLQLDA